MVLICRIQSIYVPMLRNRLTPSIENANVRLTAYSDSFSHTSIQVRCTYSRISNLYSTSKS